MNARRLAWLLPWLVVGSLWGQVTVSVILDQQQFLPGEAVPVKVRLVNHSGQTLSFGEDNSWLRISVEADDSFVVSRIGEVPVAGAFVVPPSKMATKQLDIEPYFAVTRPGRYSVIATVMVKEWGQTLASDPVSFDVITGTVLARRLNPGIKCIANSNAIFYFKNIILGKIKSFKINSIVNNLKIWFNFFESIIKTGM